tara:strand:- start:283 stop:618 length:336 start_codon:yes stop_codon:yes gene_type:complete
MMNKWKELQKAYPAIEPKIENYKNTNFQEVADLSSKSTKINDMVNNPSHYQGEIECIDAIQASMSKDEFAGHCKACCIKYLWRYKSKGGIESLEKAQWYLSKLIDTEKNAL